MLVGFEIPQTDTAVTTAGCNDLAVPSEVQGVNILLVSSELVLDSSGRDVPDLVSVSKLQGQLKNLAYSDDFVFRARSKIMTVGTEADTPNV